MYMNSIIFDFVFGTARNLFFYQLIACFVPWGLWVLRHLFITIPWVFIKSYYFTTVLYFFCLLRQYNHAPFVSDLNRLKYLLIVVCFISWMLAYLYIYLPPLSSIIHFYLLEVYQACFYFVWIHSWIYHFLLTLSIHTPPPRRFINCQSLTSTSGRLMLMTFSNNLLSIAIDAQLACPSPIIQTVLLFLRSIFFSTMSNVHTCHIISRSKHPLVLCNLFLRSRRTLSCLYCFFKIYYLEDFM